MQYQTFRGADVREALESVRQALGTDALIESTRHVASGVGGPLGRGFVEIVAAPNRQEPAGAARPADERVRSPSARRSVAKKRSAQVLDETALGRELMELRRMLDELSEGRPPRDRARALLVRAGFEGALARALAGGASRAVRTGSAELRRYLRERTRERLTCKPNLIETPGRGIIACVGPTGVGKTTTLAKLAARAVLSLGRSVRVVSLDTFRVGAVEQWRRYAELIGFPFDVVHNPGAFHRVVHNYEEELLLVDTAGRSAHDQGGALAACVGGLSGMRADVLLVLPAWLRARDAERAVQSYAAPRVTGVVITKLDETDQIGGVMHAPMKNELPIAYLCNGARVPEDIEDAATDKVLDAIFPEQP